MISIVNITKQPQPTGIHDYELRINKKVIATFQHKREKVLHRALMLSVTNPKPIKHKETK